MLNLKSIEKRKLKELTLNSLNHTRIKPQNKVQKKSVDWKLVFTSKCNSRLLIFKWSVRCWHQYWPPTTDVLAASASSSSSSLRPQSLTHFKDSRPNWQWWMSSSCRFKALTFLKLVHLHCSSSFAANAHAFCIAFSHHYFHTVVCSVLFFVCCPPSFQLPPTVDLVLVFQTEKSPKLVRLLKGQLPLLSFWFALKWFQMDRLRSGDNIMLIVQRSVGWQWWYTWGWWR